MRSFLGIISALSFTIGAITFLFAGTAALVLIVLGMVCAIGIAVLNAIEREGRKTRLHLAGDVPTLE